MRFLHTSDWHVGKTIRGMSRLDEHRAVLSEITTIAADHAVDVVLVAGDLFESSSPHADAEQLVYRTLLDLRETGAHVAVIGGNHDNTRRLRALEPLFALGNVHVVSEPVGPDHGAVTELDIGDERLHLAVLPFVSQRGIVRATDLMTGAAFEHAGAYADRYRTLVEVLCAGFSPTTVNVLLAHAFVRGGEIGGGERSGHVTFDYAVPAAAFPPTATYVALGHLHRPQQIPGATSIHYCGSPLQLDFGETGQVKAVKVVDAAPGKPAAVTAIDLRSGRPLRTVRGTIADLAAGRTDDDAWLRVIVEEPQRVGLADEVRQLLGDRAVQISVAEQDRLRPGNGPSRIGRSPDELFAEFVAGRGIDDPRLEALFAELLEETSDHTGR